MSCRVDRYRCASYTVSVTFSGLTGNTTASHIHCCAGPGTAVDVRRGSIASQAAEGYAHGIGSATVTVDPATHMLTVSVTFAGVLPVKPLKGNLTGSL